MIGIRNIIYVHKFQLLTIVAVQVLYLLSRNPILYWINMGLYTSFVFINFKFGRFDYLNLSLLFLIIHIANRIPMLQYWGLVSGLAIYTMIVLIIPTLRINQSWFKFGSINRKSIIYLIGTIILSSTVLIFWFILFEPDLSPMTAMLLPHSIYTQILAILAFALINALTEEFIFDGVLFRTSESTFTNPIIIILIPAVSYSIVHLYGIPNGLIGVILSFIYGGLMLGALRYLTGGILLPIIAHIAADLTIAIMAFGLLPI